jgi:hypothetical protein
MDCVSLIILIGVLTSFAIIVTFTEPIWGTVLDKADGETCYFILSLVYRFYHFILVS